MNSNLPLLGRLAALIRWAESLVLLTSGPALTLGLLAAIVDLATDGTLLRTYSWMLLGYAVCMAIGLDANLIIAWDSVKQHFLKRHWWRMLGYILVGIALGYVSYIAAAVFGFSHALGYSEAQALTIMGVDPVAYQYSRAGLAIALVALSALSRFSPEAKTIEDEKSDLHRELELTPLRQRLAEMKSVGAVTVARSVANAAVRKQAKTKKPTPPTFPTGGGTPLAQPTGSSETTTLSDGTVRLLPGTAQPGRKVARTKLTLRDRVYRLLDGDPTLTKGELARKLRCSESVASKYKSEYLQKRSEVAQ
jgi:hypothetical protein